MFSPMTSSRIGLDCSITLPGSAYAFGPSASRLCSPLAPRPQGVAVFPLQ